MKKAFLSIALAFGLVNPLVVCAATVTGFDLFNTRFFTQTDASQPQTPFDCAFNTEIFLDGPLSSAEAIVFPPSATQGTPMESSGDLYFLHQDFATQQALNMAFPTGQYSYTLNSPDLMPVTGETAVLNVPIAPNYTNVPYFTNYAAIQTIEAASPFTFKWNSLIPYQSPMESDLYFLVHDVTTNTDVVPDVLIADNTATSYTVPANTLQAGHHYTATVYFSIRNLTAGNGFANQNGLLSYDNATNVSFTANPQTNFNDFNGDGHPDYLLFNASSLHTAVWYLNGASFVSAANGPILPAGWSVVGTADFNGDGQPDLLLFHASDLKTYIYYMNGATAIGSAPGPTLPAGWSIAGLGDFNGDGHPDLFLFHASDLKTYVWYMNGASVITSAPGPTLPTGWSIAGLADFNGDGKPDLFLFHASDLKTYVWYLNGLSVITSAPGPTAPAGWTVSGVADFNGDGQPDLVFFHPSDLKTYIWYLNGLTPTSTAPGPTLPAGWSLVAP